MTTPLIARRVERTPSATRPAVRADIQALRALAVTLVVVYHLWPTRLPGGFVGVDVFLVISGFLITSHLLRRPPRTGRDLASFWARRIRRLLPASLLVLTTTLVVSRLVAPETQWENTARQTAAAALYVVNWRLAADSVDYLAAENAPTPVQHFWSLSVEEQFYAGWPVLVLLLVLLAGLGARRALRAGGPGQPVPERRLGLVVPLGLGAVVLASLVLSIRATASEPASAYFITPTRIWELGIGGLLAAWLAWRGREGVTRHGPTATVLGWLGLAVIVWTGFAYSGAVPFPGWRAALPVLGAAAVIAANAPARLPSPTRVLGVRPVQWLGDVSYSVYLWHWPLIVLVPYATTGGRGLVDDAGIVLLTLALAPATKRFVEDRFRFPRAGTPLRRPYLYAAAGMAVVVGLAGLQIAEVHHREAQARAALDKATTSGDPCLGAAALDDPTACPRTTAAPVVPAPAEAAKDKSDAYPEVSGGKDCWSYQPRFRVITCTFGDPHGTVDVALLGNSHAGQWLPALEVLARQRGWRITTYLASRCASSDVDQRFDTPAKVRRCRAWGRDAVRQIADRHYDLVVVSNRISLPADGLSGSRSVAAYRDGDVTMLRRLHASGAAVVAIRDTPAPLRSVPDCLAENPKDFTVCSGPRSRWRSDDPVAEAAEQVPGVVAADLDDHICGPRTCDAAVGGVVVYFDETHLTATYSRTLAPYLGSVLARALPGGDGPT